MRDSYRTTLGAFVLAAAVGVGAGVALARTPAPAAAPQSTPQAAAQAAPQAAPQAAAQVVPAPGVRPAMRGRTLGRAEFIEAGIARLTALDADGDGVISPEERQAATQARRSDREAAGPGGLGARRGRLDGAAWGRSDQPIVIADAAARLGERFDRMDADHDGQVSADERRALGALRAERRAARQAASPAPASE